MIDLIYFNGRSYPAFQANGFAARFCRPFAVEVCKGRGLDIGCGELDWCFPGATPVDPAINNFSATNLPEGRFDYIHSSHCLEHLDDWVGALNLWVERLKPGGVLFLYLPDFSQAYWRPWHNRKHKSVFTPEIIRCYMQDHPRLHKIFVSERDAYNSFIAFAEAD